MNVTTEMTDTYLSGSSSSSDEENRGNVAVQPNVPLVKLKGVIKKKFHLLCNLKEPNMLALLLFENEVIGAFHYKEIKKKGFTTIEHIFGEASGWEREFLYCLKQLTETKYIAELIEKECANK